MTVRQLIEQLQTKDQHLEVTLGTLIPDASYVSIEYGDGVDGEIEVNTIIHVTEHGVDGINPEGTFYPDYSQEDKLEW